MARFILPRDAIQAAPAPVGNQQNFAATMQNLYYGGMRRYGSGTQKRPTFTLRSLMAAITAACILLGIVSTIYQWQAVASRERQARSNLHPYGGVYTMASARHSISTGGESKGWLFITFLNHVEAVDLSPHNWSAVERRGKTRVVDDEALAVLHSFGALRSLDLRDTQVTDAGVQRIAALNRLQQLDIRGTQITEDGMQKLEELLPDCEILR